MTQYIVKNRIEEILRKLWKKDDGHNAEHRICYNKALQEVQCELDTLEVKEVDLEKYYRNFLKEEWFESGRARTISEMMLFTAKHFFELGLKIRKENKA